MKNNIKWIAIQLIVILAVVACSDDFFNESPSDRVTPDKSYNSLVEAELFCQAPIAILQDVMPQLVFACDLLADQTTTTENSNSFWQDINNHNFSSSNPYLDPSALYQVIINTNESLLHVDSIANKDKDITEVDLNVIKCNLIGVRSWAYFTLARLYGEVAYLKDNLPAYSQDKVIYVTREAILDTLINDLLPYLDNDHLEADDQYLIFRSLPMYNKALIGEIYLEKQDYTNAATYLKMAIEGWDNQVGIYKITSTFAKKNWSNIFISYNASEVMSYIPFYYGQKQPNPIELWYGLNYEYQAKPSENIINLFNSQIDQLNKNTGDIYRGLDVSFRIVDEMPIVNKYSLDESSTWELGSYIILYRAADIHLLLAEALNRSGSSLVALNIMNRGHKTFPNWSENAGIRGRAYLQPREVPEGVDSVTFIEDLIIEERSMELAFEGKRWFDLMRLARRRGNEYLADRVAAKFTDPSAAQRVREKLMNEQNWYIPFVK